MQKHRKPRMIRRDEKRLVAEVPFDEISGFYVAPFVAKALCVHYQLVAPIKACDRGNIEVQILFCRLGRAHALGDLAVEEAVAELGRPRAGGQIPVSLVARVRFIVKRPKEMRGNPRKADALRTRADVFGVEDISVIEDLL